MPTEPMSTLSARRVSLLMGIPAPELADLAIRAGMDSVILDAEHGFPLGSEVRNMIQATQAAGGKCLLRVGSDAINALTPLVDLGLSGVVLSGIARLADLAALTRTLLFLPHGSRSTNPFVPAASFPGDTDSLVQRSHDLEIWGMAETRELLEDLISLESSPSDTPLARPLGLLIGPYDLAASLGCTPNPSDPVLQSAVRTLAQRAALLGLRWGMFARDPTALAEWDELGIQPPYVVLGYDRDIWFQECLTRVDNSTRTISEGQYP